jgi:hypothetical protein
LAGGNLLSRKKTSYRVLQNPAVGQAELASNQESERVILDPLWPIHGADGASGRSDPSAALAADFDSALAVSPSEGISLGLKYPSYLSPEQSATPNVE